MFTQWRKIAAILSVAMLLNAGAGTVLAQEHHHSHGDSEAAQLALDNGKKWPTDDSLR